MENQGGDPGNQPGSQGGDPAAAAGEVKPIVINAEMLGEYKDDVVFKSFDGKPIGELLKSHKNAQSLIGGEKIVLPAGKLDTPENWAHVFKKLGLPQDAEGYEFDRPELPAGMQHNEGFEKTIKSACHYLGILPWQAKGLSQVFNKVSIDQYTTYEAGQAKIAEETESALIKELGTKEKYDEYMTGAHAALKRFGGDPETIKAFIDKFGNDALVVKVFGNVAKNMLEDAALRGDQTFDLLGENAPAQIKDIMTNKENKLFAAYWDNKHPQHKHAVDEVARLHTLVHGDKTINN